VQVLILGNGPSLDSLDICSLSQESDLVLVSNHWYATKWSSLIEVDYYCASDPRLFFPPDLRWVKNAKSVKASYYVVPSRWPYIRLLLPNVRFYDYCGENKIWEGYPVNFDLDYCLPSGDTVVCDVMIPLAVSLGATKITFAGVDLHHGSTAKHAYDERLVKSKRQSDEYLKSLWVERSSKSLEIQLNKIKERNIEIVFANAK